MSVPIESKSEGVKNEEAQEQEEVEDLYLALCYSSPEVLREALDQGKVSLQQHHFNLLVRGIWPPYRDEMLAVLWEHPSSLGLISKMNPTRRWALLYKGMRSGMAKSTQRLFDILKPSLQRSNATWVKAVSCSADCMFFADWHLEDPTFDPSVFDQYAIRYSRSAQLTARLLKDPRVDPTASNLCALRNAVFAQDRARVSALLDHPRVQAALNSPQFDSHEWLDLLLRLEDVPILDQYLSFCTVPIHPDHLYTAHYLSFEVGRRLLSSPKLNRLVVLALPQLAERPFPFRLQWMTGLQPACLLVPPGLWRQYRRERHAAPKPNESNSTTSTMPCLPARSFIEGYVQPWISAIETNLLQQDPDLPSDWIHGLLVDYLLGPEHAT